MESAANTSVLHPNHGLVTLDQGGVVNQALVDVELGHVVDNDGTFEVLLLMFSLEDMLQQSCFPGPQKPAEKSDRDQVVPSLTLKITLYTRLSVDGGNLKEMKLLRILPGRA